MRQTLRCDAPSLRFFNCCGAGLQIVSGNIAGVQNGAINFGEVWMNFSALFAKGGGQFDKVSISGEIRGGLQSGTQLERMNI